MPLSLLQALQGSGPSFQASLFTKQSALGAYKLEVKVSAAGHLVSVHEMHASHNQLSAGYTSLSGSLPVELKVDGPDCCTDSDGRHWLSVTGCIPWPTLNSLLGSPSVQPPK